MVFTSFGLSGTMLRIGSNVEAPGYFGLGSGSGAAVSTRSGLVAELFRIVGSKDYSTTQQLTFTGFVNATTMSGVNLREIAVFGTGSVTSGTCWSIDSFPAITFDGSNELSIITVWRDY